MKKPSNLTLLFSKMHVSFYYLETGNENYVRNFVEMHRGMIGTKEVINVGRKKTHENLGWVLNNDT